MNRLLAAFILACAIPLAHAGTGPAGVLPGSSLTLQEGLQAGQVTLTLAEAQQVFDAISAAGGSVSGDIATIVLSGDGGSRVRVIANRATGEVTFAAL